MSGYVKNVLVEQIYLAVTGGKPSTDGSVERLDIYPYLNAAIRHFFRSQFFALKQLSRSTREYNPGYDESALLVYPGTLIEEDGLHKLTLTVQPLKLPEIGPIIESIYPAAGYETFYRLRGPEFVSGMPVNVTTWWPEGNTIWVNNAAGTEVRVRMIPDPGSVGEEDIIPLPSGGDVEVIEMARQFFTGQRSMPEDSKVDENDNAIK